jgi:hypothetical protein
MKTALFVFLCLLLQPSVLLHAAQAPEPHAGDYKKDYAELKARVTKEKMDEYLAAWRTREPENPDAWILSSNWAPRDGANRRREHRDIDGILRLRDARHLRPPGLASPQNDLQFWCIRTCWRIRL